MASKYLEWKYRDVQPDEKPKPLSKKKKLQNWLFYHKYWIIAGIVLVWIIGSMIYHGLGIGQKKPDYQVAYVGETKLSDDFLTTLSSSFALLGEDVNGDGVVTVHIEQYLMTTIQSETGLAYQYAYDTMLLSDITAQDSYFFLTDSPANLQQTYQILANWDGTPPSDDDFEAMDKVFLLSSNDAFSFMKESSQGIKELYLGRRCFFETPVQDHTQDELLWKKITSNNYEY